MIQILLFQIIIFHIFIRSFVFPPKQIDRIRKYLALN